MLKLTCDIVPEAAKGQGVEVEKSLHGTGEGQCYCTVLDINYVVILINKSYDNYAVTIPF